MKLKFIAATALAVCASLYAEARKIHTIGDSTMATYDENTTVTRGWGQMFQQFFKGDITVNNRAKNGASSKSFYEESPYWQSVKKQIEPGDYVLIQFAHNDEKSNGCDGDELKAYYKSIGDETKANATDYRGTTASGTYKEYLRKYIEETRGWSYMPQIFRREHYQKKRTPRPRRQVRPHKGRQADYRQQGVGRRPYLRLSISDEIGS